MERDCADEQLRLKGNIMVSSSIAGQNLNSTTQVKNALSQQAMI